jgi:hypothetical protein
MMERLAAFLEDLHGLETLFLDQVTELRAGVCHGPWWIGKPKDRSYHAVLAELSKCGLPRLPQPYKLLLQSLWKKQSILVRADAVLVKTHARAFYLARGITAKIGGNHNAIQNEIRMRSSLLSTSDVVIPRIHQTGQGEVPFFIEELVSGGSRIVHEEITQDFAEALWNLYDQNGISAVPLSMTIRSENITEHLEPALRYMRKGYDSVLRARDKLLQNIQWDLIAPVGLCHGDLSDSNIVIKNGKIVLLDWEHAHRGLIIADLAKLYVKFASLSDVLVRPYRHWCLQQGGETFNLTHLFCLVLMDAFVTHWKEIKDSSPKSLPTKKLVHRLARLQAAIEGIR